MQIWLKRVSQTWADVAEQLAAPECVNLWRVETHRSAGQPSRGDLVLFCREERPREIVGYGSFVRTISAEPETVWRLFHFQNGAWTLEGFLAQVAGRSHRFSNDLKLANAIHTAPVFFPPLNPFTLPAGFPFLRTTAALCPGSGWHGRILIESLRHHTDRTTNIGEPAQTRLLGLKTYRSPGKVRVRRALRSFLRKLSDHRCAMTGERIPEIQDVIHVWPLEFGGPDEIGNLLLLDVALHRLWDRGLISVDDEHRIMVSAQLRLSRDRKSLRLAGRPLRPRVLGPPYPDQAYLRWHREVLFRGPKLEPGRRPKLQPVERSEVPSPARAGEGGEAGQRLRPAEQAGVAGGGTAKQ